MDIAANYNGYHKDTRAEMQTFLQHHSTKKENKKKAASASRLSFLKEKRHPKGMCGADSFDGDYDPVYKDAANRYHATAKKFKKTQAGRSECKWLSVSVCSNCQNGRNKHADRILSNAYAAASGPSDRLGPRLEQEAQRCADP